MRKPKKLKPEAMFGFAEEIFRKAWFAKATPTTSYDAQKDRHGLFIRCLDGRVGFSVTLDVKAMKLASSVCVTTHAICTRNLFDAEAVNITLARVIACGRKVERVLTRVEIVPS